MTDLIGAVRAKSDRMRAVVITRSFQFEGDLHTPKLGKEGRRLSNLLNDPNRKFVALTNVTVVNRTNGSRDPKPVPLIQVSLNAIEFIRPYLVDEEMAEQESSVDETRPSG